RPGFLALEAPQMVKFIQEAIVRFCSLQGPIDVHLMDNIKRLLKEGDFEQWHNGLPLVASRLLDVLLKTPRTDMFLEKKFVISLCNTCLMRAVTPGQYNPPNMRSAPDLEVFMSNLFERTPVLLQEGLDTESLIDKISEIEHYLGPQIASDVIKYFCENTVDDCDRALRLHWIQRVATHAHLAALGLATRHAIGQCAKSSDVSAS
ncbi:MAG: hypothetical protein B7X06_00545, partial [Verrucomicrobia bacterium 21-51-4]